MADSPVATALAHVNETPVAPSVHSEFAIPPALDALILECLAKDPAKRPPSAEQLAERLATAVPSDGWTPEAAHAWWELHYLSMAGAESTTAANPAGDAAASSAGKAARRCWPRLERKPLTPATVANR